MIYTLKHTTWFGNRPIYKKNQFGITPSSKFIYKEYEMETYKNSCSMMSQALLYVSNQITKNTAQLLAKKSSDESYTDGKHIVVGMAPMRYYKDPFEGMDVEMGLAVHESCHCAYTNFKDYTLENIKYPIAHWIHNLYEDECIEEMLGIESPQWMYFLDKVLSHYFNEDKFMSKVKKLSLSNSEIDIVQFMILYMVRCSNLSSKFPKAWIEKYGLMLDEIYENVISKIENPKTFKYSPTSETIKSTIKTIEIIKKYVDIDSLNNKLSNSTLGMIGNSSSEGDPNQCNSNKPTCGRNGLSRPSSKSGIDTSNKIIKQKFDIASQENDLDKQNLNDNKVYLFHGAKENIGAANANIQDKQKYINIKSKLNEEINIAKHIIIPNNKKIELEDDKFHRNGQLISSHLVQAIQGVNCVYHRKVVKTSEDNDPKYALVIAIDESGSMGYSNDDKFNAFNVATYFSIIFYEAMKNYPGIDLYIYGHGDNVVEYVTPKNKSPYKLGNRNIQQMQNETESYKTILNSVKLKTNKPILFINITDSLYLQESDKIVNFIESNASSKLQFALISINNENYYHRYDRSIELNDRIYGKDNWVVIQKNKENFKYGLRKFANIIRNKYNKM